MNCSGYGTSIKVLQTLRPLMQHPALQAIVQQSLPLSTEMALPVAPSIKAVVAVVQLGVAFLQPCGMSHNDRSVF